MKRMLNALVLLLLCLVVGANAEQPENDASTVATMYSEYNVSDAAVIPAGITPIELSSIGELRRFLCGIKRTSGTKSPDSRQMLAVEDFLGEVAAESLIETWVETHEQYCINPLVRTYFNLWGVIWIAGAGSFWQITEAYEWVGLSGPTYYVSLSESWHHTYISLDRTTATIRGGGTLDYYFVFEGVFKVASYPISLTDRFSLYGL